MSNDCNHDFFKSISDRAPFGILVTDKRKSVLYNNPAFLAITGCAPEEATMTTWYSELHPEQEDISECPKELEAENAEISENRYTFPKTDGTQTTALIQTVELPEQYNPDALQGYIHLFEDISLRLKMENQLRINFAAMESSTIMIMITDRQGIITWINPAFTQGTGYLYTEVIGKSPGFLTSGPGNPIREAIREINATGKPWQGEVFNKRKDGSIYLEKETITPVIGTDGNISHFLALKTDITEQRETEQKLREYSERLEDLVQERTQELREAQKKILLQQRLEQDFAIAAQIQQNLLPDKPPVIPGFRIASRGCAARYISGDVYDFIRKDTNTLYILVADISGKGIPAALLAASARSTVREKIQRLDKPADILNEVNRTLYPDLDKTEMFVTMILLKLDISTGILTWSNAGHTRSIHVKTDENTASFLGPTSIPVGVFPELETTENNLHLKPGEILFLYSDGFTETVNDKGDLLGENALAAELRRLADEEPETIIGSLFSLADRFSNHNMPEDDQSAVIIKRNAQPANRTILLTKDNIFRLIEETKESLSCFSINFRFETEMVITELLTNILRHAYGVDPDDMDTRTPSSIDIRFEVTHTGWILDIFDTGKEFREADYHKPNHHDLQYGGYGYYLIRQLTDTVVYTREKASRNHWHLEKKGQIEE